MGYTRDGFIRHGSGLPGGELSPNFPAWTRRFCLKVPVDIPRLINLMHSAASGEDEKIRRRI